MITNASLAAWLLRMTLGSVMLAHSLYLKFWVFTLAGTAEFFVSLGLPPILAYLVFFIEAIAGLALLLGFHSQKAALALVPILFGATWAHWQSGWLFTNEGGGWEYPMVLTLMAFIQALLGDGKWALAKEVDDVQ